MVHATTTKINHNHADQQAARREPPQQPSGQTEGEHDNGVWSEEELRAYYQLDDPHIRAMAARGGVPDADLAARLGRMLGFARRSRK